MFSIFLLVLFAVAVGVALALWVSRNPAPHHEPMVPPEEDAARDPKNFRSLEFADLFKLAERLCADNGLRVKDTLEQDETEIYWIAESTNDFFYGNYVLGFFRSTEADPMVGLTKILEFKDFIKSVGSTKGLYFTTGYFSADVHQPLEGPQVSLYNRLKVLNELKKYQLL